MDIKKLFNRRALESQIMYIARNYVTPTTTNVLPIEELCIQDSDKVEESCEVKEKKPKTNRKKKNKNKKEI